MRRPLPPIALYIRRPIRENESYYREVSGFAADLIPSKASNARYQKYCIGSPKTDQQVSHYPLDFRAQQSANGNAQETTRRVVVNGVSRIEIKLDRLADAWAR